MSEEVDFMTKTKFSKLVENTVMHMRMPYIDAVILCCEKNGIDLEDSRKYVSTVIKSKLEAEARTLNFLERGAELPLD